MSDSQKAVEQVVVPTAPARPEEYDAATRAALDHIDGQAVRAVADGRPERTRTGYAQDCASWGKFCAASSVPPLALTPGTLVMFVEWLWTQPGWKKGTFTARRPSTVGSPVPSNRPVPTTAYGWKTASPVSPATGSSSW